MKQRNRKRTRLQVTAQLGPVMDEILEQEARRERRSRGQMCRVLIEEALVARGLLKREDAA